jgi:putative transposase
MPRQPRFVLPGCPQLLIQRGNNQQAIFFNQKDYQCYLEKLSQTSRKYHCHIHAYVLMHNHIHLLITPDFNFSISMMMQALGQSYVRYINQSYRRRGTLWDGRYKATVVEAENYLLCCHRYIELNPVRAQQVSGPSHYRWSSYHHNALGKFDSLISCHQIYEKLGNSQTQRQLAYHKLFDSDIGSESLQEIRDATNKQWVLGSTEFQDQVQNLTHRQSAPKPRGGDHKSNTFYKQTART